MEIPATDFPEKPTPQLSARLSMAQHVTMILGDYCEIGGRRESENLPLTPNLTPRQGGPATRPRPAGLLCAESAVIAALSICTIKVVHNFSRAACSAWMAGYGAEGGGGRCARPARWRGGDFGRCPCMAWEPGGHTLAGGRAAPGLPLWPGMAPWLGVPGHARWVKSPPRCQSPAMGGNPFLRLPRGLAEEPLEFGDGDAVVTCVVIRFGFEVTVVKQAVDGRG
jgi:hypothetical protein